MDERPRRKGIRAYGNGMHVLGLVSELRSTGAPPQQATKRLFPICLGRPKDGRPLLAAGVFVQAVKRTSGIETTVWALLPWALAGNPEHAPTGWASAPVDR
eukprot:15482485-Alexandrium_andersonii.AAC.1